ncbi:TonB-dependent receptor [Chlorogloeopsis sp. ULAP01]|uniref:TonB-dependent receptor n=1 Tax=Chlorogloeopsis sp. ULAP01 TaxID=3056483 RepID=UPI0025AAAA68|nr:TonB-dependent receptor [Chlorogloeopsis sp. ULAP01]MDM9382303.1 TonB-dependent receptor [Chlorogloeopsis sp. ULAP01]
MSHRLQRLVLTTGIVWGLMIHTARAQEGQTPTPIQNISQSSVPNAQLQIQVTGVKVNPTDKGVEVILQTSQGEQLQITNRSAENNFIADIPNAQLRLLSGNAFTFSSQNPVEGITEIKVTNFDANTIRVTVTGKTGLPTVELFDTDEGLILGFIPAATAMQNPTPPTAPLPLPRGGEGEGLEEPSAQQDEPIELVVTGEQDTYTVIDATTATRTNTPLRDIPQSIQVVPEQVLQDQKVIRLDEAVRNVSGVVPDGSFANTRDGFNIRGFSGFFRNILQDGFGITNVGGFNETANLERVEVLKGPASVLYGNLEPGGVINLVTKKPLFEPFYSAEVEIGNYSFYRGALDISDPLNPDKTLRYRLNTVYQNSGSFRDFDQRIQRTFITPVVSWQIGKQTDLTLGFSYLNDERPFDRGLIAIGNGVADIPYHRLLGEPDDVIRLEEVNANYQLEHRFNENWKLRNAFRFLSTDTFDYRAEPVILDEETGELQRNFRSNDDIAKRYGMQTDLTGKFKTGFVEHTLLFGVDLSRTTFEGTQKRLPAGLTPSINIFNPVYNQIPRPNLSELTNVVRDNNNSTNLLGIFLQDQMALTNNLKLVVGGRFDIVDQESKNNLSNTTSNQYDEAFTPRVGMVYQPIQEISLYASYSQSFQPNFATRFDGSFLEPERGQQYEVGIRGEFLNSKLVTNIAAYEITKSNVATTDLANPGFSVAVGEQRSRGIEFDVAGEILPGWNIIASYAYTDAKVTKSNAGLEGNRLSNVPYNAASLWTTYEIQTGNLQGLGFGVGVFFVGEREGDLENTFQVPSYVRTDASIFFRTDNWRAALNFKNLFDVQYIRTTDSFRSAIIPGEPFTVIGTVAVEF